MINLKVLSILANCQKTGADLFHRKVKSKKVERNFFPEGFIKTNGSKPRVLFWT